MLKIPQEVKDLFLMNPIHWVIIDGLLLQNGLYYNTLYKMNIHSTEEFTAKCIKDLTKAGWLRVVCPAGVALDDRNNHEVHLSKFSQVALAGVLACMDKSNYEGVEVKN